MSEDTVDRLQLIQPKIYRSGPIIVAHEHAQAMRRQFLKFIQPEGRTCACNRCPHAPWCKGD
jgi:hypothetical protein